jgi:hypothetical protein
MSNMLPMQAIVTAGGTMSKSQTTAEIALYDSTGAAVTPLKKQAAQVDTTAADLAALKVDFNLLLAKLRLAGVITA